MIQLQTCLLVQSANGPIVLIYHYASFIHKSSLLFIVTTQINRRKGVGCRCRRSSGCHSGWQQDGWESGGVVVGSKSDRSTRAKQEHSVQFNINTCTAAEVGQVKSPKHESAVSSQQDSESLPVGFINRRRCSPHHTIPPHVHSHHSRGRAPAVPRTPNQRYARSQIRCRSALWDESGALVLVEAKSLTRGP